MPGRKRTSKKKADPKQISKSKRSPKRAKKSTGGDEAPVTVGVVAKMLNVDVEVVRSHIAAGAPVGPNGSINLFHYAAWLIMEIAGAD